MRHDESLTRTLHEAANSYPTDPSCPLIRATWKNLSFDSHPHIGAAMRIDACLAVLSVVLTSTKAVPLLPSAAHDQHAGRQLVRRVWDVVMGLKPCPIYAQNDPRYLTPTRRSGPGAGDMLPLGHVSPDFAAGLTATEPRRSQVTFASGWRNVLRILRRNEWGGCPDLDYAAGSDCCDGK